MTAAHCPSELTARELLHHAVEDGIGTLLHFLWSKRLDGMFHQDHLKSREPQGLCLSACGIGEFRGSKNCSRLPGLFKEDAVVHTARGARASIGQRFNDEVTLLLEFLA